MASLRGQFNSDRIKILEKRLIEYKDSLAKFNPSDWQYDVYLTRLAETQKELRERLNFYQSQKGETNLFTSQQFCNNPSDSEKHLPKNYSEWVNSQDKTNKIEDRLRS